MATVALAAVGMVLAPMTFGVSAAAVLTIGGISTGLTAAGIGAMIGGSIGSFVDSQYLMPMLYGQQNVEGPRLDDFQFQTASEGSPIRRCFGPRNPIAGQVIWMSPRRETKNTEEVGGKGMGGGSSKQTTYVYHRDMAIALCEGEIHSLTKLWAEGKLVYDTPDPVSVATELVSVRKKTSEGTIKQKMRADTSLGHADWEDAGFVEGQECTVSGFTGGLTPNNGTFIIKRIKVVSRVNEVQTLSIILGLPSSGNFKISFQGEVTQYLPWNVSAADLQEALVNLEGNENNDFLVSGGPFPVAFTVEFKGQYRGDDVPLIVVVENNLDAGTINVAQTVQGSKITELYVYNDDVVDDAGPITDTITVAQTPTGFSVGKVDDIRVYTGSTTQLADTMIEAAEGIGIAWRGIAYVVLENLLLKDFGNRPPQFKALVKEAATRTSGEVIGSLIESAGLMTSADYDVSALVDEVYGFSTVGPQAPATMIEPLMVAYDVSARKSNGVLTFFYRGTEPTITVNEADLAARQHGSDAPAEMEFSDVANFELPSEVNVRYIEDDADAQYQKGSQREQLIDFTRKVVKEVDVPLVMASGPARDIAARLLYEQQATRQFVKVTLPPSYLDVEEGDILNITLDGETYAVRVLKAQRGFNFLHAIEGAIEDRPLVGWESVGDDYEGGSGSLLYTPPDVTLVVADIPALQEDQATRYGYYVGMAASDREAAWEGGVLYRATLGGSSFSDVLAIGTECNVGFALTALADGAVESWDMENTVEIEMVEGTLASDTEENVLNGANRILLGSEIIGFLNATLTGDNTYELDTLIRGMRNTPTTGHAEDEVAIVLSDPLEFLEVSPSHRNNSYDFKGVPSEGDVATWPIGAQLDPFTAATMKAFPVCDIISTTDATDWDVVWTRRSRSPASDLAEGEVPLLESSEKYEIDVLSGVGGTVVNTYTVTTPAWTYTNAQMVTDFGSYQASINFIIYQVDDAGIGRGFASEEQNT